MPFLCAAYAAWLRDVTAPSTDPVCAVGRLLALGILDARLDSLLLPVLVRGATDLAESLEMRGAELGWNLPAGFFRERLESGACVLLVEETAGGEEIAAALAHRWPKCRIVTVAVAVALLQSSVTCP